MKNQKEQNKEAIAALLQVIQALADEAIDAGNAGPCPFRLVQDAAKFLRIQATMADALSDLLKQAGVEVKPMPETQAASGNVSDLRSAKRRTPTSH